MRQGKLPLFLSEAVLLSYAFQPTPIGLIRTYSTSAAPVFGNEPTFVYSSYVHTTNAPVHRSSCG